ncbi:hypothetical protein [Nocardiopsis sp. LOL_012]|uniref:hypothetical protein n=1 Tax=Nocardiopsis sp. LOL_012 TaxID=3345409 RepID=UPI003A885909
MTGIEPRIAKTADEKDYFSTISRRLIGGRARPVKTSANRRERRERRAAARAALAEYYAA